MNIAQNMQEVPNTFWNKADAFLGNDVCFTALVSCYQATVSCRVSNTHALLSAAYISCIYVALLVVSTFF